MTQNPQDRGVLRRECSMLFGTQVLAEGVRFRLWAPDTASLGVWIEDLGQSFPMAAQHGGWFERTVAAARPGMRYQFVLADGARVPDPASRFQPEDVCGPSEIIDPLDFTWTDRGWAGRPWEETILYELHIGTFTPEGTFEGAMTRLDYLADLGINTIQLMPVADFPGRWGWGYDGASLFAVDHSYGRPEDLKAFVNAAHERGLSVMLDVVFNHFGPKGNFIDDYAPLTSDKHTPWGRGINFDNNGPAVIRDLFLTNARFWLTEYHLDGLRLDAAHEMHDDSQPHVLEEMANYCRAAIAGRHVHLVQENSLNQAGWLKRKPSGAPWLYDGIWSDDVHHSFQGLITGEMGGYYSDYVGRVDLLGRALAEGVGWQGEHMKHAGKEKGEPSAFLPATAFIAFLQNHDQVGNRPGGERIHQLIPAPAYRMWLAVNLLSPQIPMLMMGEEWLADTPFLFFTDLGDDMADMIRSARAEDAKKWPDADLENMPDPVSESSFVASKLDWSELELGEHAEMLARYKELIALRKREITPRLAGMEGYAGSYHVLGDTLVGVEWRLGDGSTLELVINIGPDRIAGHGMDASEALHVAGEIDRAGIGPWTAAFRLT